MKEYRKKISKYFPLFLSIIIPGLGQLFKKQWKKGLLIMSSPFILYNFLSIPIYFSEFFGLAFIAFIFYQTALAMIIIYVLQIIDVYKR
jgi:hypothetical protein